VSTSENRIFNPASSRHQKQRETDQGRCTDRSLDGVRSDNKCYGLSILEALPWPLRQCLRRWAAAYGFAVELRSFLRRISLRSERRYDLYGIDLGPFHERAPDGHLRWNTRIHACTQDIESFVDARPWATKVDVETYRDAWARGAEWAESNSRKSELENSPPGDLY